MPKALAQGTQNPEGPDTILMPGAPAPFMGVLTSPTRYRMYSAGFKEADLINHNLSNIVTCPDHAPNISLFSSTSLTIAVSIGLAAFIGGMILGHNY
jgi:hypothetical protein